jgi:hypothetical protein
MSLLQLVEDWRWVLKRAWSVRFIVLAGVLSGTEVAIQVVIAYGVRVPVPGGVFAAGAGLTTVAAFVARFVAQKKSGLR